MKIIGIIAAFIFSIYSGSLLAQEKVMLGGSGGMLPTMQDLAKAYLAKNPSDPIEVMPSSIGSSGGIKAAEAGRVAIGLTARPLRPEEKAKLVYRLLGTMPALVAVHKDVPVANLSEAQICDIYAGKIVTWKEVGGPGDKIAVLTRNEDDASKEVFRQYVSCFKSLKETPEAVVLTKSAEMTAALGNRPHTIGLTDYAAILKAEGRFKPVSIDGLAPSPESVRSGKYKILKEFGVVTLGEPQGIAKKFLDFVKSPEGEQILSKNGVVVVR